MKLMYELTFDGGTIEFENNNSNNRSADLCFVLAVTSQSDAGKDASNPLARAAACLFVRLYRDG